MQQVEKTQRLLEKHGLLSFACIRMFFSRCIGIQLLVKRIDTSTSHRIMQYLRSLWSQNLKDGCYFQRWPSKVKHEQGAAPVHTSKQQDPSCPSDKCDSPHQDQGLPQILHSSEALACDASFRLGHDGFQQARISRIFLPRWKKTQWIEECWKPIINILGPLQIHWLQSTSMPPAHFADLSAWWWR